MNGHWHGGSPDFAVRVAWEDLLDASSIELCLKCGLMASKNSFLCILFSDEFGLVISKFLLDSNLESLSVGSGKFLVLLVGNKTGFISSL